MGKVIDKDQSIKILQDIIQIKSENGHEEEVAKYFQSLLADHDIESKLVQYDDDRASLVAEISNGEGPVLGITGHLDVVGAGDEEDWKYPPFSAHIDDDNVLWGRGASDMKPGIAAMVINFIEFKESQNFKGTLRLLATVGEEVGQYGSNQLTREGYVDDLDAILIGEPCNVGIVYTHMGSLNYTLTSKGEAAHSSAPQLGVNAVENLTEAVAQISKAVEDKAEEFNNEELGKTFHNVTIIEGGSQVNSLPEYAEYEANARTIPEFDNNGVMDIVRSVIEDLNKKDGFDLAVEVTADQPPVNSPKDSKLIQTIREVSKNHERLGFQYLLKQMGQVLGTDLVEAQPELGKVDEILPIAIAGTTDAAQFTQGNSTMDIAVYGPGVPQLNHKLNERIPVQQYLDFIDVYNDIIKSYLS